MYSTALSVESEEKVFKLKFLWYRVTRNLS